MLLKLSIFAILLINFGTSVQGQRLPIGIFYESLCPDSIRFITDQLYPAFNDLNDFIDINFVPFGKSSSVNGGESFICQHGPEECTGNMIQSCTLNELPNEPALQMSFVACQMSFTAEPTGEQCTTSVGVNFNDVLNCYNSELGTELQLIAEQQTQAIAPAFVPTIVYNNVFDQTLQDRSLTEFTTVVCELIDNAAPVCANKRKIRYG